MLHTSNVNKGLEEELDNVNNLLEQDKHEFSKMLVAVEKHPIHSEITEHQKRFFRMLCQLFYGDYLGLTTHPKIVGIMNNHSDSRLVFSDQIKKISRNKAHHKRILVITEKSIYLLKNDYSLSRSMAIRDIENISCSRKSNNVFVIHHRTDRDLFILTPRRDELSYYLIELYFLTTGLLIPYTFGEQLWVSDPGLKHRDMHVKKSGHIGKGKNVLAEKPSIIGPSSPNKPIWVRKKEKEQERRYVDQARRHNRGRTIL